jgi:hypothetical protein
MISLCICLSAHDRRHALDAGDAELHRRRIGAPLTARYARAGKTGADHVDR